MKYGVRRLVIINSGRFIYADLDLSNPIHLVAPNNAGKSTLVNALQYLYIDDINKMAFAKAVDDTKEHYFGENCSYLLFECATSTGIQTLLVRGLGNVRSGSFERYVYSGTYHREDYEDEERRVREFDQVKRQLADRHLLEVTTPHLWEVLTGQIPLKAKAMPNLGILPLRSHQEYRSFREVFVKLLALTNTSARDLKRLFIACHAHEVGATSINVVATYKDMFDRASRSEEAYRFILEINDLLNRGREFRAEIAEFQAILSEQAPQLLSQAHYVSGTLAQIAKTFEQRRRSIQQSIEAQETKQKALYEQQGSIKTELNLAQSECDDLDKTHEEWHGYSTGMISTMRTNADVLGSELLRLRDNLREAQNLDLKTMQKHVQELQQQVDGDASLLRQSDRAGAAVLLDHGLSRPDLEAAFRVLNPGLAHQIVGETIKIIDQAKLHGEIQAVASRVKGDEYQDEAILVKLGSVPGADLETILNREQLRNRLTHREHQLRKAGEQLATAQDAERSRQMLDSMQHEHSALLESLAKYDRYRNDWAQRSVKEARRLALKEALDELRVQIAASESELTVERSLEREVDKDEVQLRQAEKVVKKLRAEVQQEVQSLRIALVPEDREEGYIAPSADEIAGSVRQLCSNLQQWVDRAHVVRSKREAVLEIQKDIEAASMKTKGHVVRFLEEDAEWNDLIQNQEAMVIRQQAISKDWDDLFVFLRANFDQLLKGMHNVAAAIKRMNKELRSYQVSNLRGVGLVVEYSSSYADIDVFAGDGTLFGDRDRIEDAKVRLHTMIAAERIIELLDLFEIRIKVQENDGTTNEAKFLDDIGSTGTGMTAKAMILIQLVRALIGKSEYGLHFYLDETGQLDDSNLKATTEMAISRGMVPITAEPGIRMEPLAHPEVTVYTLGTHEGRFCVDSSQTYHARRNDSAKMLPETSDA